MKSYEKPIAVAVEDMSEGVYATSGTGNEDCYTVTAYIHQRPETGRPDYRIQVDANHSATHNSHWQRLVITFNQPVNFSPDSSGTCVEGDGTTTLTVEYNYWNNGTDHIGLGDLIVTSGDNLQIIDEGEFGIHPYMLCDHDQGGF